MDSVNLLVTDKSPELAEQINSLLRNSGIKIHVIHASKAVEIKRALDGDPPLLIIYAQPDEAAASIEEVSAMALEHSVPVALYADLDDSRQLIERLRVCACVVIDAQSDRLLTETVGRLMTSSEQVRRHALQRSKQEELESRYDLLLDSARDAIAYIHEGLHVYANRAYLESLRVKNVDDIAALSLLELLKAEGVDMKKLLRGLSMGEFPKESLAVEVLRPDGSQFEANLTFSPSRYNGEECIQMLMHEQDAAAELAAEIERMRVTDPLTGLSNKRAFVDLLEKELAEPKHKEKVSAVLYIEPDGYSQLHQDLSVSGVDAFINDFADVIKTQLDKTDSAARISDHGIAVLTQKASMESIEDMAASIIGAYHDHLAEIEEQSLTVSCSIGIAMVGRLTKSSMEIVAGARRAQSEAAEKGNQAVTYRPQLTAVSGTDDDRQWVDRIRQALDNQDFFTVQQPIVDLDGEGDQLVENLYHFRDQAGEYAADEFMTVADRNDLGGVIDREIIPGLLKTFVESGDRQIITISNNSILDYGFPGWLAEQLKEHCVEGAKLIIQISSAAAQSNLKSVQRLTQELEPLGCVLAISAFTNDRRSLQLLGHIQADFVKLDRSLTQGLTSNSANQEVIRKIVDAAEERNVTVIADEVTDTPSLAILWQCGVKMIAGAFLKENSHAAAQ